MESFGIPIRTGIAITGIVGLLEGNRSSPGVLLRFDMDALPIQEENICDYASQKPGMMHACGHDGHVAVGFTIARILSKRRNELPGYVQFVFQPAEEGAGGAERMIDEGIFGNNKPDFALAFHVWNQSPLGWLGLVPGPMMAGVDDFHITLTGKGGHAAMPEETVDPVVAAAHIITALQTVVTRNISPLLPAVISVTQVKAGSAFNVIPQTAELCGTIRTFETGVRELVLKRFTEIVKGVGSAMGCTCDLHINALAPAVINDPEVVRTITDLAKKMYPEMAIDATSRTMGAEDMSFFLNQVPGCFVFVGSANNAKGLAYPHHHPKFDFDEQALPTAVALLSASAITLLNQRG